MMEKTDAAAQEIEILRQIHHLPLILRDHVNEPKREGWTSVSDPFDILKGNDAEHQKWTAQEFNYFHDTIQNFLFACDDKEPKAFDLYRRDDLKEIHIEIDDRVHVLSVERLTLHEFKAWPRVAILTLETLHTGCKDGNSLTLADTQSLIDHMRRSYVPFWNGTSPARCPVSVSLVRLDEDDTETVSQYPIFGNPALEPDAAYQTIERDRCNDAPLFAHWRALSGLRLNDGSGDCEWRDPSDERIPTMSFIALRPRLEEQPRETMLRISEADWVRIADAEEAGNGWPYNREFLRGLEQRAYYDRFLPDEKQSGDVATRHIFGGAHYSLVTVSEPGQKFDFARDVLQRQFQRHYAQMSLCVRFEMAMLLGFSRRAAIAAAKLQSKQRDETTFAKDIVRIHREFLIFVSRFRFTGVSSQIQGVEMFDRWRDSLGLRLLYDDVRTELDATAAYVRTEHEERRSKAADRLNLIAFAIAAIALILGVMATPLWELLMRWWGNCDLVSPNGECALSAELTGLKYLLGIPTLLFLLFFFFLWAYRFQQKLNAD